VARVLAIRDGGVEAAPYGYGYTRPDGAAVEAAATIGPPPTIAARAAPPVRAGLDVREVRVRADFALAAGRGERRAPG